MTLQALPTDLTAPVDTAGQKIIDISGTISRLSEMETSDILSFIVEKGIDIGLKVLAAIIIYTVGAWLIRKVKNIVKSILLKRKIESSLSSFILSFISISLTILLIIVTVQTLGVDTSSFVALLAGSGVAIGMAMSGTLQNLSGGIMLLVFKPFKVGDYIEAQGYEGTVESIQITATILKTVDNKTISLPNGALSSGTINNFTASLTRRCDWNVNIPYGSDFNKAKELILEILERSKLTLDTPAEPFVGINAMDNGFITVSVKAWVKSEDYWTLFYFFNENIYKELPINGFAFPIPKMNINILNENE